MRRRLFNLNDPWFRPLWRRVAVTGVALGWGLFELASGSGGFGVLFLALGAYAAWSFFATFNPGADE